MTTPSEESQNDDLMNAPALPPGSEANQVEAVPAELSQEGEQALDESSLDEVALPEEHADLSSDPIELIVEEREADGRLDQFLALRLHRYSRMQLRRVVDAGGVLLNGSRAKVKVAYRVATGDRITITLPPMPTAGPNPENIPLDILFEDEHLIAVNKPPGMVVHPARGHWSGTLTSALAYHFQQLSKAGGEHRPGIVHRLDRDTSGVMVVAKTDPVHFKLAEQFAGRTTAKEYFAITAGVPDRDRDIISQPIGMHAYQREKMAIRPGHSTSRDAETMYHVLERFAGYAAIECFPKTGRTHQIRVHMAHVRCPVLCDRLYGGRAEITEAELIRNGSSTVVLGRQALHARKLSIDHPVTGERLTFEAPLSADINHVLEVLRTAT